MVRRLAQENAELRAAVEALQKESTITVRRCAELQTEIDQLKRMVVDALPPLERRDLPSLSSQKN